MKHLSSGVCAWPQAVIMSLLGFKFFHKEICGYFILLQRVGVMLARVSQVMDTCTKCWDANFPKWVTHSGKLQNWYGPCNIGPFQVSGKIITHIFSTLKSFLCTLNKLWLLNAFYLTFWVSVFSSSVLLFLCCCRWTPHARWMSHVFLCPSSLLLGKIQ